MKVTHQFLARQATASALLVLGAGAECNAEPPKPIGHERLLSSNPLLNVRGSLLTAVVVSYGPGERSPAHHHAGSVFAYVLSGEIRSQNSATGPARVYRSGESFFEPAGSVHQISENASPSKPAKLLAVFVAEQDAKLTTPELAKP